MNNLKKVLILFSILLFVEMIGLSLLSNKFSTDENVVIYMISNAFVIHFTVMIFLIIIMKVYRKELANKLLLDLKSYKITALALVYIFIVLSIVALIMIFFMGMFNILFT